MKLIKILSINGEQFSYSSEEVRLELNSPGRATFTVNSAETLTGMVTLDVGYGQDQALQRWFTGYIEKSTTNSAKQQVLFCRELSASLNRILPLAERHITLEGLAKKISESTHLVFSVPDKIYSKKPIAYFYSANGGYHTLDSIGEAFDIPNFIWQQQGDGRIFFGSWDDSFWASRPINLPTEMMSDQRADESAKVAIIPRLRPGILLNSNYLQSVTLSGAKMRLTWSKQLKK